MMTDYRKVILCAALLIMLSPTAHSAEGQVKPVNEATDSNTSGSDGESTIIENNDPVPSVEDQALSAVQESDAVVNTIRSVNIEDDPQSRLRQRGMQGLKELQNAIRALLDTFIEQKIITQQQAQGILRDSAETAQKEAAAGNLDKELDPRVVRVPYVPQSVMDDIRNRLRGELRSDVVQDVMAQAETQRWGVPNALPSWISHIKIKGDYRLRAQGDMFDEKNVGGIGATDGYINFQELNEQGGFGKVDNAFLNTTEDRTRLRTRVRLSLFGKPGNNSRVGIRMSTGNLHDPVSTNQTLGNSGNRYQVVLDQAYLSYTDLDEEAYPWLTYIGGRMPNPWFSTDLVWDKDLGFEGLALVYQKNMRNPDDLFDMDQEDRTLFAVIGAFPLQEVELSSRDKWLFGAQAGMEWITESQSRIKVGLAYYDFKNIEGQRNKINSTLNDFTAPQYMQKGNTLFDIRNDIDPATDLWALASDYNLLNLTASADFSQLAPMHVIVTMDYVKNIGYDRDKIIARSGGVVERSGDFNRDSDEDIYKERTTGYKLKVKVGWPKVALRGTWDTFLAYKYLERDAVLDLFTDSDFHLGGTDAKGWIVGSAYALDDNILLSVKYLSATEIDHNDLAIDVFQIDLNALF